LIEKLKKKEDITADERLHFSSKAFAYTSYYDSIIYHHFAKDPHDFPVISLPLKKMMKLRYGENPHQSGYFYQDGRSKKGKPFEHIHGKELSYNNLSDLSAAISIINDFDQPTAVIVKHSNPCGLAYADDINLAFKKAKESDPISAFGGIIALNRVVDQDLALLINEFFNECLIAPGYTKEALDILRKKKNRRILKQIEPLWRDPSQYIQTEFGYLIQEKNNGYSELEGLKLVSGEKFNSDQLRDLEFAWKAVKFIKSNSICLVKKGQLIGVGAGQMSRVDSVKIAIRKCQENGHSPEGAILASDAFFPFRDNIDFCASYKPLAIIQPGGSNRDSEVIEAAKEHHITMYLTGKRHFKH